MIAVNADSNTERTVAEVKKKKKKKKKKKLLCFRLPPAI